MLIAALFTMLYWKQHKYPTAEEKIRKMWYLQTMDYVWFSYNKKHANLSYPKYR